MAIVYSYEQATQPALGDLLLGTDVSASGKPTKSFSIQSIVDLVQTGVPGGGTVTSIGTNSSTFVTMSGGPITTSGIVSASLSATGTPSATTYLRGDNTWATIGASANTTYTVTSAQNGSAANIRLTGSDSSQTIVTLAAGPNVVLTDNGTNRITIGLTGLATGSVTSVTTGAGLSIISGTATINPVIAVDYLGLNNYIKINESQATPTSNDVIPFDQVSSTNVKTTNLGAIPITALTSVKSYVDAGDVGDIRNDTDTFTTTAAVNNVVSLTSAEYTALATKNANTLYIIVGAAASFTTTLAFTNNIVGTEYTINGDQAGATKSGVAGASYAYNTTLTPNAGFFFSSGPTVTNATGTFSVDETVYTILGGTVEQIVEPPITATLAVSTSGVSGTEFTLGGNISGATITGPSPLAYAFNTTISPNAGFEFVTPPTINNASGTITTSQTVVTTITGELQAVGPQPVAVTPALINNFTGESSQVSLSVTPGSFSGDSPVAYSFTPSATANSGYIIENLSFTGDISGSATSSKTAVMYANGNVIEEEIGAVVELIVSNQITGGAEGTAYAVTGNQTGNQQSGPVPFVYGFSTNVTANSGYEFTSLNITNASGTTNQAGLQYVTTTITGNVQAALEPVCATLNVVKNITGEQVYSITGNDTGAQQCGLPPFDYSFTTGVSIPAGYEWTTGPTISPNPNSGTISTNTTVNTTISGIIAASIVEGTVNLAFSNNVNGSENTTTALGASTSITGPVGDPYTFTNSISANSGYEFTIAPSWDPTAVITGTIASGTTNLTQSVTGTVTAIPVQLTSFTTNASPEVSGESACSASLGTTRYHDGASTYPEINDTVYLTNSTGGGKLGAGYWGLANSTYFQTNSSGVVIDVQLCPAAPVNGTVNVNFTNTVSGAANTTTTIADGGTASATGQVGTSYSIVNSISANNGYEFTVGPTWSTGGTGTVTGTFVSGTTEINQNVTGTVEAVAPGDCVEYSIFANSGVVFSVSYINCDGNPSSINVPGGDEAPICSTVYPTVTAGSGTITPTGLDNCSPPEQYTVTLAFSNNVTNNEFTTTSLTPGATITGNPGDSYQFVHTITTDPGYEFTSGPTWVDNVSNNGTGTINGTIPNSNTTITQSVSGVVESSATCTSFAAGPNSNFDGVCEAIGLNTYYHNGAGSYPVAGDTVYSEPGCSTFLAAGYYLMSSGNYIRVIGGGQVLQVGNCE